MSEPFTPVLDRQAFFDEQSRAYKARDHIGPTARYRRIWKTRPEALDQGREGMCVAFACAGMLAATPIQHDVSNESARMLFRKIKEVDEREGRHFESGATVLAGMKALQELRLFGRYVWNFGIGDTIDWIIRRGPVIFGINWYEGLSRPDDKGLMRISGAKVGGHAILGNGFWPKHPDFGDVVVLTNSWGKRWGANGHGFLPVEELDKLLQEDGESVSPLEVPLRRLSPNGDSE
jgi:hypothetical protein